MSNLYVEATGERVERPAKRVRQTPALMHECLRIHKQCIWHLVRESKSNRRALNHLLNPSDSERTVSLFESGASKRTQAIGLSKILDIASVYGMDFTRICLHRFR